MQPESFPLHHDRLEIVGADVLDPVAVDAVVAQRDAVLSTLGVPAGKEPITPTNLTGRQAHRPVPQQNPTNRRLASRSWRC